MKPKKKEVINVFKEYNKEKNEYFKIGKILRRFRLDEIPQLINIFKGEISLVGPRPLWDKEYVEATEEIKNYSLRNITKPGIAGWAQLKFRAVRDIEDCKTRFGYDIHYTGKKNIKMDVNTIKETAKRIFIKEDKMTRVKIV
jgi:lipopolysaccharide/colanic/teichoic acid biosynthesis glycosyltransferase